jgi:DnaK suppressor protein
MRPVTAAVLEIDLDARVDSAFPLLCEQVKNYVVRPGESPWTVEELREIAGGLLCDKERLDAELAVADRELIDLLRRPGQGSGDDPADYGSSASEREHELTLVNNLRSVLVQTELALSRIKDGTYSVCEATGSPIGKMRLQAFPRATLCVEAKARQERRV